MTIILLPYVVGLLVAASLSVDSALGFTTTTTTNAATRITTKRPVILSSSSLPSSSIKLPRHQERVLLATSSSYQSSSTSSNDGGKTLTPTQILNPEIYLSPYSSLSSPLSYQTSSSSVIDDAVPLFIGLRLLTKSLERIISTNENENTLLYQYHLDGTSILRIEQIIHHRPLSDHQAQASLRRHRRRPRLIHYVGYMHNKHKLIIYDAMITCNCQ
jgi:hypothetical protein